jgi:hypothetical protein
MVTELPGVAAQLFASIALLIAYVVVVEGDTVSTWPSKRPERLPPVQFTSYGAVPFEKLNVISALLPLQIVVAPEISALYVGQD